LVDGDDRLLGCAKRAKKFSNRKNQVMHVFFKKQCFLKKNIFFFFLIIRFGVLRYHNNLFKKQDSKGFLGWVVQKIKKE